MLRYSWGVAALALAVVGVSEARGQYSKVAAPFGTAGDSFYENIGVGWGFRGPNFSFNSVGPAPPPFGGHIPGADASFGVSGRGNGFGFNFNVTAGQGSSRTFTSQTPTLVVPNGVPGFLFDGQQRPFVTGLIPVVGAGALTPPASTPHVVSPLAERLARLQAEQALQATAARASKNQDTPAEPSQTTPARSSPPKDDPPLILRAP